MKLRDIVRTVIDFLFSRANREFLIFLFFFAVAGVFWLLMTLNETYEREVRVSVHFVNVPKQTVLTSPEVDTVRVVVRDKGYVLATYLYDSNRLSIDVDFRKYAQPGGKGSISVAELAKKLSHTLNASTKVVSIKPDKFAFYYNNGEKKRVPVRYSGNVTPEDLYFISGVQYQPDSITIYATKTLLDSIGTVMTEELNYSNFRDTLSLKAGLQRIPGVKMVPNEVAVRFVTDVLIEESISDIPVVGINMPAGKTLRTFPARVGVAFVTGVKTFQKLKPFDFEVVADYNEFSKNPSPKCELHLTRKPQGISKVKLLTSSVDYLIEENGL